MNSQEWTVMNPAGDANVEHRSGAVRIDDFSGRRVGLWWNGKPNGDNFLNEVARQLESRNPGMTTVRMWELSPSTMTAYGVSGENLDKMVTSADVVIGALGD